MRRFLLALLVLVGMFMLGWFLSGETRKINVVVDPPRADPPHTDRPVSEGRRFLEPVMPIVCGDRCGVQRWQVKTMSDADRHRVDLQPVRSTVESLGAIPRPPKLPSARRVGPAELTVYEIDAYLGGWDDEADGDIHLILFGLADQRASMVAEIPNPRCGGVCASGLGGEFAAARAELQRIVKTPNPLGTPVVVRVTGVGFFDHNHGQTGAAPNFIELHPVLRIERRQERPRARE